MPPLFTIVVWFLVLFVESLENHKMPAPESCLVMGSFWKFSFSFSDTEDEQNTNFEAKAYIICLSIASDSHILLTLSDLYSMGIVHSLWKHTSNQTHKNTFKQLFLLDQNGIISCWVALSRRAGGIWCERDFITLQLAHVLSPKR